MFGIYHPVCPLLAILLIWFFFGFNFQVRTCVPVATPLPFVMDDVTFRVAYVATIPVRTKFTAFWPREVHLPAYVLLSPHGNAATQATLSTVA